MTGEEPFEFDDLIGDAPVLKKVLSFASYYMIIFHTDRSFWR